MTHNTTDTIDRLTDAINRAAVETLVLRQSLDELRETLEWGMQNRRRVFVVVPNPLDHPLGNGKESDVGTIPTGR